MSDPFFFTSYARLDSNRVSKLSKAVDELRERVRALLGAATLEEAGFFDVEDIATGDDWEKRLGRAASRCRVFVCFCSNTYLNREVCAKEFEVFRRRMAAVAGEGGYVVPILWDRCELPKALAAFHAGVGVASEEYLHQGLCALRRTKRQEYQRIVEELAQAIDRLKKKPALPHGAHPVGFDALVGAFDRSDRPGPRVCVLHPDGLRWSLEHGATARAAIDRAAAQAECGWSAFRLGEAAPADLAPVGGPDAPLVAVVGPDLDPVARLRLARFDAWAAAPGRFASALVGAVRPALDATPGADEALLRETFPLSFAASGRRYAVFDATSASSLEQRFRYALALLKSDAARGAEGARVEDATLAAAAHDAGVPIAARPMLAAPGAGS